MAGTRKGSLKSAQKCKEKDEAYIKRYGVGFYQYIGSMGGKVAPGPFKFDKELARRAGRLGGLKSRKGAKNV